MEGSARSRLSRHDSSGHDPGSDPRPRASEERREQQRPPLLVVVTGPPASGKSTVAAALAERLSLPLVAKDGIKETLFDTLGTGDREWSRRLGRATYPVLFHVLELVLRAGRDVLAEANFATAEANAEFDALRRRAPFRAFQIYCTAPRDVLLARFSARARDGTRHRGHVDDRGVVEEVRAALDEDRHLPLALEGELVELDTSSAVDVAALVRRLRELVVG